MDWIPKSRRFQGLDGSLDDAIVAIQIGVAPTMCILGPFCMFSGFQVIWPINSRYIVWNLVVLCTV